MLLPVFIKGERFLALLDTGSTHNFVQGAAMRRLGLSPTGGEKLRVTVANGDRLACEGIARDVPIRIGEEDFSITCVGLNLGAFDFIIGFDFLRTLGPMLWDCDALTLSFGRNGRRITWQGVPGPAAPTP
jgi:predicted aspartyl protease